ncbi:MAG: hypothetical protein H8E74_08980 [Gammaproteobacteria bacterium]|nr:hypothetical protein [Gammaproteobacteria bacterium]
MKFINSISSIVVGVRNMDVALDLWISTFGFEVLEQRKGADPDLSKLWGLDKDEITQQTLIATPSMKVGMLHFVEFKNPSIEVRESASSTDLGPKNLDITCKDLPERYNELLTMGHQFRSKYVNYRVEATNADVIEVQMPGHDSTNIIFMEWLGEKITLSDQGYGGITSLVTVVPDLDEEAKFYQSVFGLKETIHEDLFGPHVETMIGLPKGGGLVLKLLEGDETDRYGRVELVNYVGADKQVDRYKIAKPPALGTLHCNFRTDSLDVFGDKLNQIGIESQFNENLDLIHGKSSIYSIWTPAGLRIDVME